MEEIQSILVICDCFDVKSGSINQQLLGKARELVNERKEQVVAILWGENQEYARELLEYGADEVAMVDVLTDDYTVCSKVICKLINQYKTDLILFPGTPFGKKTAGTVAAKEETGLIADCIDIKLGKDGKYVFSRAALSSTIIANIVCENCNIQMCTIKPNVFANLVKRHESVHGTMKRFHFDIKSDLKQYIDILESTIKQSEICNLSKAKVIFAAGRGVAKEDFQRIKMIAKHYKAEIGGTRIMVENGLISKASQIGQSGINVAPDLYIAFGISGANQHIAGIKNAKSIIAINSDENAPIFQYSDFGLIADVHEIIDEFMKGIEV